VVAALVGGALALPGTCVAQEPLARDSVTSVGPTAAGLDEGGFGPRYQEIAVDVSSGPSGESPMGGVSAVDTDILRSVGGTATCLAVRGKTATFNVVGYFGVLTVQVVDAAPDTFNLARTGEYDVATEQWISGRWPEDCSPLETPSSPSAVVLGDLRVVDAQPPLPTSRRQCHAGGWRLYGFRNDGQCVRYVQTGRPLPGPRV
jgi:hypothetical protein